MCYSELDVIASIHARHTANIINGLKLYEVRKDCPRLDFPFKCLIYCTKSDFKGKELVLARSDSIIQKFGVTKHNTIFLKPDENHYSDPNVINPVLNGMVVGEFVCDSILTIYADQGGRSNYDVSQDTLKKMCLTQDELWAYANGQTLYAWHISNLTIYDEPKPISLYLKACQDPYHYCQACRFGHIVYPESVECYQDLEGCSFEEYCTNIMTRAPQSWCYTQKALAGQVI